MRFAARFAVISGLAVVSGGAVAAQCSPDSVTLRGEWGQAQFSVEVADDVDERARGLMNRKSLPGSAGMLFFYPQPRMASFWMKNTLIALDMIFVDETGVVTRIHENAVPLDTTLIDGGNDVLAVLEINAGLAKAMGISVGTELQHPGFDQKTAIWVCEGS